MSFVAGLGQHRIEQGGPTMADVQFIKAFIKTVHHTIIIFVHVHYASGLG